MHGRQYRTKHAALTMTTAEKALNPPGDLVGGPELQVDRKLRSLAHPLSGAEKANVHST